MAARDRWTTKLRCPKCGNSGEARMSEDDYPFMRSPGFSADDLPEGFTITKQAETQGGTEIVCTTCKVKVF